MEELVYCKICKAHHTGGPDKGGIKQQKPWDCGIACLYYETGKPFEWWFEQGAPERAMYPQELRNLLRMYGYAAEVIGIRERPTIQEGDYLIIQVGQRLGGHIVVVSGPGEVMDPTDGRFHCQDGYLVHWVVRPGQLHGKGGE